jgi:hypothetical protein
MTVLEQLTAARELIVKGWTQNVPARRADGRPTPSWESDAVRWCASGALGAALKNDSAAAIMLAAALPESPYEESCYGPLVGIKMQTVQTYKNIASFNDHPATTQEDVLALYDRAIQEAK